MEKLRRIISGAQKPQIILLQKQLNGGFHVTYLAAKFKTVTLKIIFFILTIKIHKSSEENGVNVIYNQEI